jgi:hypothetical protein
MVTCMSRANSYSSSVSTLTINALSGYSTASCDKNPEAKVSHEFTNTKINNTNVTITSFKEMKKKKKKFQEFRTSNVINLYANCRVIKILVTKISKITTSTMMRSTKDSTI